MRGFEETVVDWTQPRWFETVFFIVYWVAKLNALTASPQTMVRISPPASTYLNKGWWKLWSLWLKMMSKRLRCPSREGLVNVIFTGAVWKAEDCSKVDGTYLEGRLPHFCPPFITNCQPRYDLPEKIVIRKLYIDQRMGVLTVSFAYLLLHA